MGDHAALSPSSRHRWGVCPASVREEAKYPEPTLSNLSAVDGTHTHSLLETCIKTGIDASALVGTTLTDHEGQFTVDAERAERVQVALDYIRQRCIDLGVVTVRSETKVDPAMFMGRSDMAGTVDCMIVSDNTLEIIDYKDGMNPVGAVGNLQLEQYAWGALAEYVAPGMGMPFKYVTMTIIQPKLRFKGMPHIVNHVVSMEELLAGQAVLITQAQYTDNPNAPYVPGENQCKYCRARGGCKALAEHAMAASGITFENLDLARQMADRQPNELTDEQIREMLEAAPLIRQMLEAAETEAMRRFTDGKPIEGLKVVRGRGSRSWALNDTEIAAKLTKMGVPKGEVYITKLISPSQAEKLKWTKRDGVVKQLSEKQLKLLQTELVRKSDGSLSVVPESDLRPAVVVSAAPLFNAVEVVPELPSWLLG
jgi:hypothetical protein